MHYVPHILYLIVHSGLKTLDKLFKKIQKITKYIESSAQRDENFTLAPSQTKLNTKRRTPSNVDSRWNSTFQMVVASLELGRAVECLKELDFKYKCMLLKIEWENEKKACDYLKIFLD